MTAHAALFLNATVVSDTTSTYGEIEFTTDSSVEVASTIATSAALQAHVTVSNSARLIVAASSAVSSNIKIEGDLNVKGSAILAVDGASSIEIFGSASFDNGTSYEIKLADATAATYATVNGAVQLGGSLVVTLGTDLSATASATVVSYGSRLDSSVFADLTVTVSAKRSKSSDYEVTYNSDGAVISKKSSSSSDSSTGDSSTLFFNAVALAAFLF